MNRLIKGKAFTAHKLPATGNMIGFAVQTVARSFTAFARAAGVGSMAYLITLFLWRNHELREFKGFGSRADGYALLETCPSLDASVRPMPGGPGVDSAALSRSLEDYEHYVFLTYIFLSHLYSLIFSARLYVVNLDS